MAERRLNKSPTSGNDAAYMTPKLIPDEELRARDNSGGIDFRPYTAEWDDGGYITGGPKPHLSTSSSDDDEDGHEDMEEREEGRRGHRHTPGHRKHSDFPAPLKHKG